LHTKSPGIRYLRSWHAVGQHLGWTERQSTDATPSLSDQVRWGHAQLIQIPAARVGGILEKANERRRVTMVPAIDEAASALDGLQAFSLGRSDGEGWV
jgi:hypothetical protein